MATYNYLESIKSDVLDYINDNVDTTNFTDADGLSEFLNEELWCEDSVTGNASGSYTFSTYQAEQNLSGNLYLISEALSEFGQDITDAFERGAEFCDVTIRCHLLSQAISDVLNENDFDFTPEEDEDD